VRQWPGSEDNKVLPQPAVVVTTIGHNSRKASHFLRSGGCIKWLCVQCAVEKLEFGSMLEVIEKSGLPASREQNFP